MASLMLYVVEKVVGIIKLAPLGTLAGYGIKKPE